MVLTLVSFSSYHYPDKSVTETDSAQIITLNKQFAAALRAADLQKITSLYAADAVAMPEYHTRVSGNNIREYFRQWLAGTSGNELIKTPFKLISSGNYVLETGNFTFGFNRKNNTPFSYKGKYIQVWRKDGSGKMKIVSQIWGSSTWFDKKELPEIKGIKESSAVPEESPATGDVYKSLHDKNRQIANLVKQRAGQLFAPYYTADAIYMPYYSPMIIGRDSINNYYIKHEDPNVGIDSVAIHIARLLEAGKFYITDGVYSVDWRSGQSNGRVNGKSINIWRKEQDGQVLLHWQMTTHDF